VSDAVATFLGRQEVRRAKVCAAFSRPGVLGRFFRLPPLESRKRVQEVVTYEAKQQIPFPLEELLWDYEAPADSSQVDDAWETRRVVLIAAKREPLLERVELCKAAGLPVHVVQSDALALHNFFAYDYFGSDEGAADDEHTTIVVLDVGCDATHVLFSTRRSVWFRTATFGSDGFTSALARTLPTGLEAAEALKRQPLNCRRMYQFDQAIRGAREEILAEVLRTMNTYQSIHPEAQLHRMFAVGGGMCLHGMLRHLRVGQ